MTKGKATPTVGARISGARKTYRMSQQALGENLGVTRAAVSQYEKDIIRPKASVVELLTQVFNTGPEWFETGVGRPPAPVDVPVVIPEIDLARLTEEVIDLRNLSAGRKSTLPTGWFQGGPMISPAHLVTFVSPTTAPPVHEGDRVVVDLLLRLGPPGVFLVLDPAKGPCLRQLHDLTPGAADILGRVVAYFRGV